MIKQKYLFKVIAIAIMVVMVAVACKEKPTDINPAVDIGEEITPPKEPIQPEVPEEPIQPEGPKVKIDPNGDLKQFLGYYYESGEYRGVSGTLVFTARVGRDDKQAYIEFEDGFKFYQGVGPACKGANYKLLIESGKERNGGACQYADVVFYEDGYIEVKFNNYYLPIRYSLQATNK